MFNRKNIKKSVKKDLLKNYWNKIFVCLLVLILVGNYSGTRDALNNGKKTLEKFFPVISHYNIDLSKNTDIASYTNTTGGMFKVIFDKTEVVIASTQVYLKDAEKAIKNVINNKEVISIISVLGATGIALLFKFFVLNIISIGEARFFLETRKYTKTKFTRLFSNFKKNKYLETVKTMFMKNLYLLLWFFTIIGGIIKIYSYRMVQYIVAENPSINYKDAIKLSRIMMQNNKFKMFITDLSFIGYQILNIATFGLVGIFFLNPYMKATEAEIYFNLRNELKKDIKYKKYFNDSNLDVVDYKDYYPGTKKEEIKLDYYRKYSPLSFILFFFSFAITGWLWEVLLYIIKDGRFVNRGTMLGPWLPIYGFGCVFVLLLLIPKNFKKITDNPILTFFIIMFICAVIEYLTSWYLEVFKCDRWWDYSGYFLNINGRVCLECSLFFGIGGTLCIYVVAPFMDKLFNKVPTTKKLIICLILVSLFSIDSIYSHYNPNKGAGITDDNHISKNFYSKYCKK